METRSQMKVRKQKLIIEFECPDSFIPFIMRDLNKALMKYESVQKPRIMKRGSSH